MDAASSNSRRPLPQPTSLVAAAALRAAPEEAERIICERLAAAGKPCHLAATFCCPKPNDDFDSDAGSGTDDASSTTLGGRGGGDGSLCRGPSYWPRTVQ